MADEDTRETAPMPILQKSQVGSCASDQESGGRMTAQMYLFAVLFLAVALRLAVLSAKGGR